MKLFHFKGQTLIELILAMGLAALIFPALITGFMSSREGKAQQQIRMQAVAMLKETEQAVKSVRNSGWDTFTSVTMGAAYHPVIVNSKWSLSSGTVITNGLTQSVVISNVSRNAAGDIVTSGGTDDPSTKKVDITISWTQPSASSITSTTYYTRSNDAIYANTTDTDFSPGTLTNTQITKTVNGEILLGNNNKGKWCSPSFANTTIDLPDGPPVAVAATASTTDIHTPNDVFVATAPNTSSVDKMAYVKVTADTDNPTPTLQGVFTMDSSQYSVGTFPSGTGLDNNFKTNDIKYYKSAGGKLYALMATNLPEKEVVAVQINDGSGDAFQDPTNKIYKYWTYFNTNIYAGATATTALLSPSANAAETSNAGDNDGYGSNPTRAYTADNSFAVDLNSGSGTGTSCAGTDKDKHQFYNYNVYLPSYAAVAGVEVQLKGKVDATTGAPVMCVQLSWDGGTTWTTAKTTSTLTTSNVTYTLGGSNDTWGRTWTTSDFSNSNFRVRVIDVSSDTTRDFSLDSVGLKVYSSSLGNDQAPYGYGASTLKIFENKGYILSGGFLYVFDLSNIDSKSTSSGLDQVGCRVQVEGSDCKPGSPGTWAKYTNGQTGTTYGSSGNPSHNDCSDGGNIALFADEAIDVARVAGASNNLYGFVAIGGQANDELDVIKMQSVPSNVSSATCGVSDGTDWKEVGHLDFNPNSGTEEAANSVYAKTDGSRVYMTSNGGTDSKQFYVINTSTPATPQFLTTAGGVPASGFYNGNNTANGQLYPKRSLTVQNGLRAVLVGKDGIADTNNAEEYQVVNMESPNSESLPKYCGGLDYDTGFNDLTSVSELDGDNYVYMVANTPTNQLRIIQGGPDSAIYVASGTYVSPSYYVNTPVAFNRFDANIVQPTNTSIKIQVAVEPANGSNCNGVAYTYLGPNGTSDPNDQFTTNTVGASTLTGIFPLKNYPSSPPNYQNPGQCFSYKVTMQTFDQKYTPQLQDITWNYSQ